MLAFESECVMAWSCGCVPSSECLCQGVSIVLYLFVCSWEGTVCVWVRAYGCMRVCVAARVWSVFASISDVLFYLASRIKKFFVHYSKFFTLILTSSEPQVSFVHFITAKSKKNPASICWVSKHLCPRQVLSHLKVEKIGVIAIKRVLGPLK